MNNQKMIAYFRNLHNKQMDEFLYTLLIFEDTESSSSEDIVAKKLKQQLIEDFIKIPNELKTCRFLAWCLSSNFFLIDYIDDSLLTTELKKKILLLRPKTMHASERYWTDPELYQIYDNYLKNKSLNDYFFDVTALGIALAVLLYCLLVMFEYQEIAYAAIGIPVMIILIRIIINYQYSRKKKKEFWRGL